MLSSFSLRFALPVALACTAFGPAVAQALSRPKRTTPPQPYQPEDSRGSRVNTEKKHEGDTPPEALDIRLEGGKQKKFELSQISKASTGVILRGAKEKPFTPLTVVMDAIGIQKKSRILVKGVGTRQNELLLQVNALPLMDPNDYGFIFNPHGFPQLVNKAGPTKTGGSPGERWPEVKQVISIEVVPASTGK